MRRKKPTTDTYCLSRAQGGMRVALFVPAVGCQRVVGGKHGSGRGFFGLCRDPGFLGFTVDSFLKPDPASVVRHQRPKL